MKITIFKKTFLVRGFKNQRKLILDSVGGNWINDMLVGR